MTIRLFLSFGSNEAQAAAVDRLRDLGIPIVQQSTLFRNIAVEVPESSVPVVQGIPGIIQLIKDVAVRPACCEVSQVLGLTLGAAGETPPARDWRDVTVSMEQVAEYVHVPEGPTGKNVSVAVVDTGVYADHPALRDRVAARDSVIPGTGPDDVMGHGTFISGQIGGRPTDSPLGPFQGIAPDVDLLSVRVFDDNGAAHMSDVTAGLERAYVMGAKIINLSLGSPVDVLFDPVADAIEELARRRVLVVAAGGNFGPRIYSLGTPASARHAFAVAAVSTPLHGYIDGGVTAAFSSRGPSLRTVNKPDIALPGGAGGDGQRPQLIYGPTVGILDSVIDGILDEWGPLRGTSMAAPIYSGILALAAESNPTVSWTQVARANQIAGRRGGPWKLLDQGWGVLDATAFLRALAA